MSVRVLPSHGPVCLLPARTRTEPGRTAGMATHEPLAPGPLTSPPDAAAARGRCAPPPPFSVDRAGAALLQAGCSSLADLLAPSFLEIDRGSLCLDGRHARTFVLVQYPRTVAMGWLDRLISSGEQLDLSLHLVRLDAGAMQGELTMRMVQLRSSQLHADKAGRLGDDATETALGDCARVRRSLQEGHDAVHSASLYVTVYGFSLAELDERALRVQRLLATQMAQTRPAFWQAQAGLHSTLPAAHDGLRVRRNLDTRSLVMMFPFTSPSLQMEDGVLWGRGSDNNALVLVNPFARHVPNANLAVMATSGAGKSYAVKLDLLRTLPLGIHAVVIDPEAEYVRLATALGGQVVHLAPGSPHRLNPLAVPRPAVRSEAEEGGDNGAEEGGADPLAAHVASLSPLFDVLLAGVGQRLSPREQRALERALATCYEEAGITADVRTHGRTPPVLDDLHAALCVDGDLHGLAERLERYCAGPLARIFNGQSTVQLDNRLVVFSLQGLSERSAPEVRTAVMMLIAGHVWRLAMGDRAQRRRLIVDEAHVLARYPAGDLFLEDLARRARKYGLGLTVISQQLDDFLQTNSGRAVLKNSGMRLLLLQTEETLRAMDEHLLLSPRERGRLLSCRRGEGLLLVGRQRVFVRLEASPLEHRLCHTDAGDHQEGLPPLAPAPVPRAGRGGPPRQASGPAAHPGPRMPAPDQAAGVPAAPTPTVTRRANRRGVRPGAHACVPAPPQEPLARSDARRAALRTKPRAAGRSAPPVG